MRANEPCVSTEHARGLAHWRGGQTNSDTASVPLQIRFRGSLLREVDNWRRAQPDIPTRAEAIRRLLSQALSASKGIEWLDGVEAAA